MPSVAYIDRRIVPLTEARVPVTDRGFLWGDHVFEVLRTAGGHPCDGEAHLARLAASAARLGLAAPPLDEIDQALAAVIAAAGEPALALRVVWTAGDGRALAERAGPGRLVITAEPLEAAPVRPVRLVTLSVPRVGGLVPADAKTGNYLASVLAITAARAAGADDAIFVDGEQVLETAASSLLVVGPGDTITTPTGALLPGVTARRVAALLGEAGHPVTHVPVTRAQLRAAREVFCTSARRGVTPVIELDGDPCRPGPITELARTSYDAWIAGIAGGNGPRSAI